MWYQIIQNYFWNKKYSSTLISTKWIITIKLWFASLPYIIVPLLCTTKAYLTFPVFYVSKQMVVIQVLWNQPYKLIGGALHPLPAAAPVCESVSVSGCPMSCFRFLCNFCTLYMKECSLNCGHSKKACFRYEIRKEHFRSWFFSNLKSAI